MSQGLQGRGRFDDPLADDGSPGEIERYRAWIAVKLLQGLGALVLLAVAIVLFDSW